MYSSHKRGGLGEVPAGFTYFPAHFDPQAQAAVLADVRKVIREAPFFAPAMPRTGRPFSVRMTNCGVLGWVSDRTGYRYQPLHPVTGEPWPPIPDCLIALWDEVAAGAPRPEACLINYYGADAKMGSHRDEDEEDRSAPVVSVSLGDDAVFHIGGQTRSAPRHRFVLRSGDVAVLGGSARNAYHGIDRVRAGTSRLLEEGGRINLTLRRVRLA